MLDQRFVCLVFVVVLVLDSIDNNLAATTDHCNRFRCCCNSDSTSSTSRICTPNKSLQTYYAAAPAAAAAATGDVSSGTANNSSGTSSIGISRCRGEHNPPVLVLMVRSCC